jgi:hypothetical protein
LAGRRDASATVAEAFQTLRERSTTAGEAWGRPTAVSTTVREPSGAIEFP